MVDHWTVTPGVVGSSPISHPNLPRPILSVTCALAGIACATAPAREGDRYRPLGQRHYTIVALPSGELLPSGWKPASAVARFRDPDFFYRKDADTWILVSTQFLTHGEQQSSDQEQMVDAQQLALGWATDISNLPFSRDARIRVSGADLPFGERLPDAAERLILQDNPHLTLYVAIQRVYRDEEVMVVGASRTGDPPFLEARSLMSRVRPDHAR